MKTITALATAKGVCAIHIIRVSGTDTYAILSKLAHKNIEKNPNTIEHVKLYDKNNEIIDDVLLMKFVSPKSFTGEDLVEINCHGNDLIADKIITALLNNGAVIAQNGEFSKRALINNKMNSLELYAMNNLIKSTSNLSMKFSLQTLLNKEVRSLDKYEEELFHIIGRMEVLIDYPEFNDDPEEEITTKFLISYSNKLLSLFENLIEDAKIVIPIFKGIEIAIVGVTNAGKSSLLNKIIKQEKAIVSNVPGTTRDVVEAFINVKNRIWKLQDTAGIHKTLDFVENIGINKSKDTINNAKLILMVVDGSDNTNYEEEKLVYDLIKDKPHLIVINKSDLPVKTAWKGINISTMDESYIQLLEAINKQLDSQEKISLINNFTLQDERQLDIAINIKNKLIKLKSDLENNLPFDLVIGEMHDILRLFQEMIGKTNDLNFIDRLFANFCVGK